MKASAEAELARNLPPRQRYGTYVKEGITPMQEVALRRDLADKQKQFDEATDLSDRLTKQLQDTQYIDDPVAKAREVERLSDLLDQARKQVKQTGNAVEAANAKLFDVAREDAEIEAGEKIFEAKEIERKQKAVRATMTPEQRKQAEGAYPYNISDVEVIREEVEAQLPHSLPEYKAYIEKYFYPDRTLRKVVDPKEALQEGQALLNRFVLAPKDRPTPGTQTPEMVKAAQAGDARAALRAIEAAEGTTPLDKAVAKRLLQLGSLPKVKVVPADQVKGSAAYDTATDTVLIADGEADSHTIIHEIVHSALHKLIRANEDGKRNDAGYRDLKTLFDHITQKYPQLVDEYGMKDVSEFASEAMSNPQFQKKLAVIPYKAQTAWQWFGKAVRSILKLPQQHEGSALLEALTAIDKTLYEGRKYQVEGPAISEKPSVIIEERQKRTMRQEVKGKIGDRKVIGLRTQVSDSLAGVEATLDERYKNKIRDNEGNFNPAVLLSRALDALRFSKAIQEVGTGKIDPGGLITADTLTHDGKEISYYSVMKSIVDEAAKRKVDAKAFQKYVDERLYAHREFELRKVDPSLTFNLSKQDAARLETEYRNDPFLKQVTSELDAIRFSMIDLLVETGRISKKKAKDWKDATGYIPFSRISKLDNEFQKGTGKGANRGLAVFKQMGSFKGSTLASASVTENFSEFMDWATKEAMRTEAVGRALRDMVDLKAAEKVPSKDALPDAMQGAVVETFEDGAPAYYFVPDPANLAAFAIMPAGTSTVVKFVNKYFTQPLRAGVTVMPPFAFKQIADDITRAYVYSGVEHPVQLMSRILTGFGKNWYNEVMGKKSDSVRELERHGIIATYDFHEQGNVKNIMQGVGLAKVPLGTAIMRVMEAGAKASDITVREAIYNQTLKETGDAALAEHRAREIINFSRRGAAKSMDFMIRVVPFFNAYARGMDKLALAAAGNTAMQKVTGTNTGSARALFHKRMLVLFSMGLGYAMLMHGDEEYEELPDQVRDRNWIIPVPKEYREKLGFTPGIPVPAELGFFFKALPERIVQYYKLQGTPEERQALDVAAEMFRHGVDIFTSPNITPQVFRPILEAMTNYSFFLGRPLESQMQIANRVPSERTAPSTSAAIAAGAQWLAKETEIEVSPIKVEHVVRGLLGTSAGTLLGVADMLVNPNSTDRPIHRSLGAQITGASTFMKDNVGSRFIDEVYRLETEVEQAYGSYTNKLKTDPVKAGEYLKANKGLLDIRGDLRGVMQQIRQHAEVSREIDKRTDLPPDARLKSINMLREMQNDLARRAYGLRRAAAVIQHETDMMR